MLSIIAHIRKEITHRCIKSGVYCKSQFINLMAGLIYYGTCFIRHHWKIHISCQYITRTLPDVHLLA
ncbi:hypothetical protein CAP31_11980 [Sulfuriferula sp. AH1]|nr:hypothetical protein CAP31_11980 [Sulfuriferula sp. AH1]